VKYLGVVYPCRREVIMEPIVTIIMRDNCKTLGDWDQKEIDWLLTHMDWIAQPYEEGYIEVSFYIPVTK
jgi:hypothetical protein